jgi:peptide-methionine (S)-S-oxide reductase
MIRRSLATLLTLFAVLLGPYAVAQTATTPATPPPATLSVATFAGGCFWCMEKPFDVIDGVSSVYSGYMGGTTVNPTYEQVSSGRTGHTEVVQIAFDPAKVSYDKLLDIFWRNVDPIDKGGQFCDRGSQYRPEIFFHNDEQKSQAEASKAKLDASKVLDWPVVVPVTAAAVFTKAEEYHQKYYKKNPGHYTMYRLGCGRDQRLEALWGKVPAKTN